jgi:hypothetical protein
VVPVTQDKVGGPWSKAGWGKKNKMLCDKLKKKRKAKRDQGMVQVTECFLCKREALNSNSNTTKRRKGREPSVEGTDDTETF